MATLQCPHHLALCTTPNSPSPSFSMISSEFGSISLQQSSQHRCGGRATGLCAAGRAVSGCASPQADTQKRHHVGALLCHIVGLDSPERKPNTPPLMRTASRLA